MIKELCYKRNIFSSTQLSKGANINIGTASTLWHNKTNIKLLKSTTILKLANFFGYSYQEFYEMLQNYEPDHKGGK